MPKRSAGLLLFRRQPRLEVLLAHPGGPLHAGKDVWTLPKGEYDDGEPALVAAYREFEEELGIPAPQGEPLPLGEIRQRSGKLVTAWALEGDLDTGTVVSNTFSLTWPPGGGVSRDFPEVARAQWFDLASARLQLLPAQVPLLDRLDALLGARR